MSINELTEYQKGFWTCFSKLSYAFSIYEDKRDKRRAEFSLLLDLNISANEVQKVIENIEIDPNLKQFLSGYIKIELE